MSVGYPKAIFCSSASWWLFYISVFKLIPRECFRVNRKSSLEEFYCRIVTLFHALLVVVLSISSVFINQTWPFREPAGPNLDVQEGICILSIGYFLFDLGWCLYHKTEGWFMLFHHLISITCFAMTLYRGIHGDEVTAILFATELTNPLLQLRWYLLNVSLNKTGEMRASPSRKRKLSECDFEFIEKDDINREGEERPGEFGNDSHVLDGKLGDANGIETAGNNSNEALDDLKTSNAIRSPMQPKKKRLDIIVVDILFFALFTLVRVILGTIYFGIYQSSSSPDILARLGATVIYLIGLIFWFRMVGYLSGNYFGASAQTTEK